MLPSWEARWFFEGEPFDAVRGLFATDEGERRTDTYLLPPGVTDLGIKVREGRFEVKGLVRSIAAVRFGHIGEGALQQWVKWSAGGAAMDPFVGALLRSDLPRVEVAKARVRRKLRLDAPKFTEVRPADRVDRGVTVELADLEVAGQRWWSIAFEAFPDDSQVPEHLLAVAGPLLEKLGLHLPAKASCAYPAWLQRVGGGSITKS